MATLEIKKICKNFDGIVAVKNLSLSFEAGSITGLIGPNGSGKSTLINILTGVVPFDSGSVSIDGGKQHTKIQPHELIALGSTRTFQEVRLFEQMSVLDNILVVLTKRNILGAIFETGNKPHLEVAKTVIERVGLWEKRNVFVSDLSYGQRKLTEIARALATGAEIYFFDEPFAGLFPEMRKDVASIMCELRRAGKTIVLVEHNMEIIRELSDYCIVLDGGVLLAEGNPEVVLSRKEVIEAYLGV
jgi:ABC-type branched-subunit amino acid transport system ATPase component